MKNHKQTLYFFIIAITTIQMLYLNPVQAAGSKHLNTCKKVAAYIKKNTKKFAKEYNKTETRSENKFKGTSVEKVISVKILGDKKRGIYLDFNKKNGYMVIASNGEVIDFEVSGELTYLKKKKLIYYSRTEQFMYKTKSGEMASYKRDKNNETNTVGKKVYEGMEDGRLINPTLYVKDRYGKKYELKEDKSLIGFPFTRQFDTTIYYTLENGNKISESNCTLNSIYATLGYLQKNNSLFNNLPSLNKIIAFDASTDSFYDKYKNKKNFFIEIPKRNPLLYQEIRQYAIEKKYYKISGAFEGTNPFRIKSIMKYVCKQHDIKPSVSHKIIFDFKNQVKKEINAGYPTIFNMSNHAFYGGHTGVVTGYKVYKKKCSVLGIKFNKTVQIMEIADNWNENASYIDYDRYNWPASFVKIRK